MFLIRRLNCFMIIKKTLINIQISKIVLLAFLLSTNSLLGQDDTYFELIKDAQQYYKDRKYALSVQKYDTAFSLYKGNIIDLYNGACSYSLNGDTLNALKLLKKAIHLGYSNTKNLKKDVDLLPLHSFNEWPYLVLYSENNKKNVNQFYNQLEKHIEKRDTNGIKELFIKDKAPDNVNEIFRNIRTVYQILDENNIKHLYDLELKTGGGYYKQGYDKRTYHYKIHPQVYNEGSKVLIENSIAFDLNIEIRQFAYKWYFHNLEVDSNYINQNYCMNNALNKFLKADTFTIKFEITSKYKAYTGYTLWDKSILNLPDLFKDIEWLSFEEGRYTKPFSTNFTISIDAFSEYYQNLKFRELLFPSKEEPPMLKLEIIFTDSDSDIIAISIGRKYAFYKFTKHKKLEKFLRKKTRDADW